MCKTYQCYKERYGRNTTLDDYAVLKITCFRQPDEERNSLHKQFIIELVFNHEITENYHCLYFYMFYLKISTHLIQLKAPIIWIGRTRGSQIGVRRSSTVVPEVCIRVGQKHVCLLQHDVFSKEIREPVQQKKLYCGRSI